MVWVCYIIMIAVPYLLAGLNTSIIVCKIKTGKDIRTMGSGNAGLTNTLRSLGKGAGGSGADRRCGKIGAFDTDSAAVL